MEVVVELRGRKGEGVGGGSGSGSGGRLRGRDGSRLMRMRVCMI